MGFLLREPDQKLARVLGRVCVKQRNNHKTSPPECQAKKKAAKLDDHFVDLNKMVQRKKPQNTIAEEDKTIRSGARDSTSRIQYNTKPPALYKKNHFFIDRIGAGGWIQSPSIFIGISTITQPPAISIKRSSLRAVLGIPRTDATATQRAVMVIPITDATGGLAAQKPPSKLHRQKNS